MVADPLTRLRSEAEALLVRVNRLSLALEEYGVTPATEPGTGRRRPYEPCPRCGKVTQLTCDEGVCHRCHSRDLCWDSLGPVEKWQAILVNLRGELEWLEELRIAAGMPSLEPAEPVESAGAR